MEKEDLVIFQSQQFSMQDGHTDKTQSLVLTQIFRHQ